MTFSPVNTTKIKNPDWIIKNIMEAGTVSLLYGDSFSGKTYFGLYLAYCIITGQDWFGYPVKRSGPVLYLCGEGEAGIERRLKALEIKYGKTIKSGFYISDTSASLAIPETQDSLINSILAKEISPVLLIVDPWSKNLGGDENSSRDTESALKVIEALQEKWKNLAVLIIHHTGHAVKDRARGSYALKCAVDMEMQLDRDRNANLARVFFTKMKDGELPDPLSFSFSPVSLGIKDEDGQEIKSATIKPCAYKPKMKTGSSGSGKNQITAKQALTDLLQEKPQGQTGITEEAWKAECEKRGITHKRFSQTIKPLIGKGKPVNISNGFYMLNETYRKFDEA